MADKELNTASSKVNTVIEKNKKGLIAVLVAVIACLVIFIIVSVINSNNKVKNLGAVETISYNLTEGSTSLDEDALNTRRNEALTALGKYTKKGGVVGVRANMLAAEIYYEQKNYSEACSSWEAAAKKSGKAYTAPICYYNLAACYENLNDTDNALANYKKACEFEDFVLLAHAKFSYARLLETKGDFEKAVEVYNEISAKDPDDTWAELGKSRVLSLKADGKVN